MFVIVGLGNPGKKYEQTKHNIGFLTLDYLAKRHDISITKIKHKALIGEGRIHNEKVILVKPQTFMNLSGESVSEVLRYYDVSHEDLIVIYDDVDIPMGRIRIRKKGSAGGQNGMKNILYHIGTDEFPRIRIGIGKSGNIGLVNYVLSGFSKEEKDLLEKAVIRAADAVDCMIRYDIDTSMNEYNRYEEDNTAKETEE